MRGNNYCDDIFQLSLMLPENLQSKSQQKTCLLMTTGTNLQIAKKDKKHEKVGRRIFVGMGYICNLHKEYFY